MRRLVLWVVVPFVLLAAAAFWLTARSGDEVKPPERVAVPVPEPAPVVAQRPAPPPSMPARAPLAERTPQSPPPPRPSPGQSPPLGPDPYTQPEPPPVDTALAAPSVESQAAPQKAGTVDKEDVRAAIRAVTPLVKQCFADAEKRYPGEQSVTLSFTVKGQGLTGYLDEGEVASSSIRDPWLQQCFLEAISEAKFPPPRGGGVVRITYPFRYVPNADAGQ